MNKKTVIILLPIDKYNRIDNVDKIEGKQYMSLRDLKFEFSDDDVIMYTSHNQFMWDWNNHDIDINKYWLTYVYVN